MKSDGSKPGAVGECFVVNGGNPLRNRDVGDYKGILV